MIIYSCVPEACVILQIISVSKSTGTIEEYPMELLTPTWIIADWRCLSILLWLIMQRNASHLLVSHIIFFAIINLKLWFLMCTWKRYTERMQRNASQSFYLISIMQRQKKPFYISYQSLTIIYQRRKRGWLFISASVNRFVIRFVLHLKWLTKHCRYVYTTLSLKIACIILAS